ncbi:molecular chaperone HtpG [Rhizobium alvei]|uniref:Chaperone protein HtpG n=2 Tax=Rhizobium alvei TaxID=1132659 RepID=A0ABT8YSP6_9HYPH|nr:molecular chaperone HtpG [Rhizobium alvei]MDO6966353.1 molecular chaperone HtpG [Rhizobium alvei]
MMTIEANPENHVFAADVARLLHMMVHSVYSDRDVFLRELISNAADACEKLRYEAIAEPALMAGEAATRITLTLDKDNRRLMIEDNGIGMSRDEMIEALGTIAHSGTRAFMERFEAEKAGDGAQLIGQFGVGFYSAFMVAGTVEVASRRAGSEQAWLWSSDGKGAFTIAATEDAPARGTRVTLNLLDDADKYTERHTVERIVRQQSGHVPVPILLIEKPGEESESIGDGTALWTRSKNEISEQEYNDFYRGVSGLYDDPALTVHFRAEGRHEYTTLAYVPGSRPFDLFDPDRAGRMKLYVKRVFITDEAELLPRYLRFVRGLVDTADLPLNVSREMIQESPILAAIRKGVTNRILTSLEKLAENDKDAYAKVWDAFGSVLKEGIYEDFERKMQILALSRFKTSTSGDATRSLADYVGAMKDGQSAIFYATGDSVAHIAASPHLEGFMARGIEVLYLTDPIDSFWVQAIADFEGKPLKSITQGASDLAEVGDKDADSKNKDVDPGIAGFIAFVKETLADAVVDARTSERLTESPVCLVAPEYGPDRQLEKLLQGAGRLSDSAKPVLEINATHKLIRSMASVPESEAEFRKDLAWLLLDEARILDGEKPADPRAFARRLGLLFDRALPAAD